MNLDLATLRKSRKITQTKLAEKVGVTQRAIVYYEKGQRRPSPEIGKKIGDFFGLSTDEMWQLFYSSDQTLTSP